MRRRTAALGVLLLIGGCSAIPAMAAPDAASTPTTAFSHADFDRVLARLVDGQGRVDYTALQADPGDLDRYMAQLAAVSPESHPGRFPTTQAQLAYWINAYNAAVIKTVLRYYPIASVRDVRPPKLLFFLPAVSGFFLFQAVTLGGDEMSLYTLENSTIRGRFTEPRVHFALNCASRGCPRLPAQAFSAEHLDEEFGRETKRFMAEERNVRVDAAAERVWLSSIFDWYDDDFVDAERRFSADDPTLVAYVRRYAPAETAAALSACRDCRVEFIPYDWRLNDQRAGD